MGVFRFYNDWSAVLDEMPGVPKALRVSGGLEFATSGWSAELAAAAGDDDTNLNMIVLTDPPGDPYVPPPVDLPIPPPVVLDPPITLPVLTYIRVEEQVEDPKLGYKTVTVTDATDRDNRLVLEIRVVSLAGDPAALADGAWTVLDWETANLVSGVAGGWILAVTGESPVPMDVELYVMPVGIAPEEYRGVLVRGRVSGETKVVTPWEAALDVSQLGKFILIGATNREYFPPPGAEA
ncbi:MAG: hypothetical protein LC792_15950 [Actinobacteria bacterium]|nr:hypothetical protein [Actinomycetota bacterium]